MPGGGASSRHSGHGRSACAPHRTSMVSPAVAIPSMCRKAAEKTYHLLARADRSQVRRSTSWHAARPAPPTEGLFYSSSSRLFCSTRLRSSIHSCSFFRSVGLRLGSAAGLSAGLARRGSHHYCRECCQRCRGLTRNCRKD